MLSCTQNMTVSRKSRMTINVGGLKFQTLYETVERFPTTLLGCALKRDEYRVFAGDGAASSGENCNEFFFDRNRASFEAIFRYYQTSGAVLERPEGVSLETFLEELKFFELEDSAIKQFWINEGYTEELEESEKARCCLKLWQVMDAPQSSLSARMVAVLSILTIVCATLSLCMETLPEYQERRNNSTNNQKKPAEHNSTVMLTEAASVEQKPNKISLDNPFFVVEAICVAWFLTEFILRLFSCPSLRRFVVSFLNWMDFAAIVPFIVHLAYMMSSDTAGDGGTTVLPLTVMKALRLLRVFRIFKLTRYSRGLQVLAKTLGASIQELGLLVYLLLIGVVIFASALYIAEGELDGSEFRSIIHGFWYAIITMTTVGYGDLTPVGPWGKILGSACAITGVIVVALPIPVIAANFERFYHEEEHLEHLRLLKAKERGEAIDEKKLKSLRNNSRRISWIQKPQGYVAVHCR